MSSGVAVLFVLLVYGESVPSALAQSNAITIENQQTGNPASEWDVSGAGDLSIQGFATDISVNKGGTIQFKIDTDATNYRLDIYRLGYYGGMGARFIQSVQPSIPLPQLQPDPLFEEATGLVDCGNWAVSASWVVPSTATSGLYIAKLVRTDGGGTGEGSHIAFVVRDDSSTSEVFFQTSDTTWQAYNTYGGNSFYRGNPVGRAYKVSYNRPFITRQGATAHDWIFNAEYPMIRWLEANGYDVSYTTGVDTDRSGNLLLQHKLFLSVGHDEYWSGTQRTNVESARNAGVNMAFFSGNEVYWKTRWEPSIDGTDTAHRTLVCYKETFLGTKIDPSDEWTGTWRDPRLSPPHDGGRPENSLTGTIFKVDGTTFNTMSVPAEFATHRFWRDTSVAALAPGDTAQFADGLLGYEWDEILVNGFQPAGQMKLSLSTHTVPRALVDYGKNVAPAVVTHSLSLYRHSSGALIFGAGTVNWPWALDEMHDASDGVTIPVDPRISQATVNLFADMGVQPKSLQAGLIVATKSSDTLAPVSTLSASLNGSTLPIGSPAVIAGTASDIGGIVWSVEVSTDGGATWQPANGRGSWTFSWTPSVLGSVTIKSRAVDDSGNLQTSSTSATLTVVGNQVTIWPASAAPTLIDSGFEEPLELGIKFRSTTAGTIKGIRFYKAVANTGTHVGNLWTSDGTLLATATFSGESVSGWQQMNFSAPVSIAPNTVYIASYFCPNAHYSTDIDYFASNAVTNGPLQALAEGTSGPNGLFKYSPTSTFPDEGWRAANYWVDVAFQATPAPTLNSIAVTPAASSVLSGATQQFTATGTYSNATTQNLTSQVTWASSVTARATINSAGLATGVSAGSSTISATFGSVSGNTSLTVQSAPLSISTASLSNGVVGTAYSDNLAGTGGTLPYTWSLASGTLPTGLTLASSGAITGTPSAASTANFVVRVTDSTAQTLTKSLSITVAAAPTTVTIWSASAVPTLVDAGADSPVELGVKFRSDVAGTITGIRFYKASTNTGTHVGNLWSSTGTLLASATFTETASGWQQVTFSSPVAITANTVYVASYHVNGGHYSADLNYFSSNGVDNGPLHALANGVSGSNGVFAYGANSTFPSQSYSSANYWVDVLFQATPAPTLNSIAVTPAASSVLSGATQQFTATGTYSNATTQNLTSQVTWASSVTARATINSAGLATGVSAGSSTISATFGSVSGNTSLTVQSAPLSISTASLSNGVVGTAYSDNLAGTGGTLPYTWSLASGTLPTGLTLASSGAITGTPSAASTANFVVRVTDSTAQTLTKSLSITVAAAPTTVTIWSASAVPTLVDAGADSPVELGVKFRSDVAGTITGIRFYKASTNTGTHVGNLWSSTGTLLASATFTETASGWQQVTFSSPVAITANTVYVASYHVNGGHYSADLNYFSSNGVDNGPLHALANGVSGSNGVFAYGANSTFPSQSYSSANYWVDVLFQATPAPTLNSIAVTPAASSVLSGATQQFTATGTYSNATTQNLTSQVTWASSVTARATINSAGLATGVSAGSSTISATFGSVSGNTSLTVQSAPLSISTASLSNGVVGTAYSDNLAGTGGTLPYTWSLASGTLPTGLTLASSGAITGTPSAASTANFVVRVTDSTAQTLTKSLSITVAAAPTTVTIWSASAVPTLVDAGADSPVELGVKFRSDVAGTITGIRFYKASTNTGTHVGNLWSSTGTLLASATFTETASGWQQVTFSSPVAITANTVYVASYHVNGGHYSADLNYFSSNGVDNGPLHALANGVSGSNGVFAYGANSTFPTETWKAANYWVDVAFQAAPF